MYYLQRLHGQRVRGTEGLRWLPVCAKPLSVSVLSVPIVLRLVFVSQIRGVLGREHIRLGRRAVATSCSRV